MPSKALLGVEEALTEDGPCRLDALLDLELWHHRTRRRSSDREYPALSVEAAYHCPREGSQYRKRRGGAEVRVGNTEASLLAPLGLQEARPAGERPRESRDRFGEEYFSARDIR
jgi:hypothetical protein